MISVRSFETWLRWWLGVKVKGDYISFKIRRATFKRILGTHVDPYNYCHLLFSLAAFNEPKLSTKGWKFPPDPHRHFNHRQDVSWLDPSPVLAAKLKS